MGFPVVVTPRRSTPSARPSQRPSSPTLQSTRMPHRPSSSRRPSSRTIGHSSSPTPVAASQRSSVVRAPVRDTRSRTDKGFRPLLSVLLLCSLLAYLPTIVPEPRGLHFLYALPCPIAFRPGSFRCLGSHGRRCPFTVAMTPPTPYLTFSRDPKCNLQ